MLEQRLGHFIQSAAMLRNDLRRAGVLLGNNPMDFRVDFSRRFLGYILGTGNFTTQENGILIVAKGDGPERTHPPITNHVTGDFSDLFDITRGSAGNITQDQFFRNPTTQAHRDLIQHALHRVSELIFFGNKHRAT